MSKGITSPLRDRFEAFIVRGGAIKDCWGWKGALTTGGYGQIKNKGKFLKAHRVSYELFRGPIPQNLFVCHACDVRPCTNPDHLFLGTPGDNMRDMVAKGRNVNLSGENHAGSKLTKEMVLQLRLAQPGTIRKLARKFGVDSATAYRARNGITWSWL